MAEYIERETLLDSLRCSYYDLRQIYTGLHDDTERQICAWELNTFMECILRVKEAPAADVVEVVRCKDCKYFSEDSDGRKYCDMLYATMLDTDYCAYAKRRDGAGDD